MDHPRRWERRDCTHVKVQSNVRGSERYTRCHTGRKGRSILVRDLPRKDSRVQVRHYLLSISSSHKNNLMVFLFIPFLPHWSLPKLVVPNTDLGLNLAGGSATLLSLSQVAGLFILPNTPKNQQAIVRGQLVVPLPLVNRLAPGLDQVHSGQWAVSLNVNGVLIIADYE